MRRQEVCGWLLCGSLLMLGGCGGAEEASEPPPPWPELVSMGDYPVANTIIGAGMTIDGEMQRFYGVGALGTDSQDENQPPLFDLYAGAVLKNVIISAPAADGVHCNGSCTLENVWWEDVGEDAATFRGDDDSDTLVINGGGARLATDKVFQHNGRGTLIIKNFHVQEFGKLYRSCGNCEDQVPRKVVVENVTAVTWERSAALVGINENYGDSAEFVGETNVYDRFDVPVCQRYMGNDRSAEPMKTGAGPDGVYCKYDGASVVLHH